MPLNWDHVTGRGSPVRAAGLNAGLHEALAPWRSPTVTHDPAKVPLALAMTFALGGDTWSQLAMVRAQPAVDGPVAFGSTLSRVLAGVTSARS